MVFIAEIEKIGIFCFLHASSARTSLKTHGFFNGKLVLVELEEKKKKENAKLFFQSISCGNELP